MKILPPVSIQARRVLPSRWDVLAAALVLGFIVLFADASRSLLQQSASIRFLQGRASMIGCWRRALKDSSGFKLSHPFTREIRPGHAWN